MAGLAGKIVQKQMESQVKEAAKSAADAATPETHGRQKGKKKFLDYLPFGRGDGKPSNHRKMSFIAFFCCCCSLCGLCGLIFSYMVDFCWNKQNKKAAERLSSCVYNCNLVGIAFGIVAIVCAIVLFLIVVGGT